MREVLKEKFVNEGDLGLPQGKHCYEGASLQMREGWQLCNQFSIRVWTKLNFFAS